MGISEELQSLSHGSEVVMFELSNFNPANPLEIFYFSNDANVIFNGVNYIPIPCEVDGIQYTSEGTLPRPKLRISDADKTDSKIISSMIYFYGGLEGATVTIRRTLRMFLDTEPTANPLAEKPKEIFQVSQKLQEIPGKFVEFELSATIDFVDEVLGRPCIVACPYIYRDADCGYAGTAMFTFNNKRTLNKKKDVCAKTVDACQKRFGNNNPIPHGGYPALRRY